MYRNQRPIFTPIFFTPIIRTLKTEGGGAARSLKFRGGEIPKGGRDPQARSPGKGQITRDLAPRGPNPWRGEISATPVCSAVILMTEVGGAENRTFYFLTITLF